MTTSSEEIYDCIIIGSGLAGMTTALSCLDRGAKVVMLEKEAKLGGNSMKASSGINAACPIDDGDGTTTVSQQQEIDAFVQDTKKSAGSQPNAALIEILVNQSAPALMWLKDRVQVDLLQCKTRLGGHSSKRTFRPVKGAVGYSVMSGMQKALEAYHAAESGDGQDPSPPSNKGRLTIMTEIKMTGLVTGEDGKSVIGVTATAGPESSSEETIIQLKSKNIVLATGGFAADRTKSSLLAQHRPDLLKMPATFGDFSTGDGIQLATSTTSSIKAKTCLMDKVQIHPTGFVDPADPTSPTKFLCAELLRGIGGILLNEQGERFCNELGTRDYVVNKMMMQEQQEKVFYIVLGSNAAKAGAEHVGFYTWKKLLQKHTGIQETAQTMGIPKERLEATIADYCAAASKGAEDAHGKTFFPNLFMDNLQEEEFLVGKVTPVLHYCMGGLSVNPQGKVLDEDNNVIPGLHAVGEVAGGTHGDNRLAGNSLLECLVFGRIIGENLPLQQEADETKVVVQETTTHSSKVNTRNTECA
ncbi:unnamed protein product [Cylindrotheca closterium]|uniref:fumarate reductase (NADH) n=1 Tax=Cylindrotheca closterium TaxID=2856 RepID=A0AAD2FWI6_9STRA|nr:unnamed protein product [Cylindrotheca closterium]